MRAQKNQNIKIKILRTKRPRNKTTFPFLPFAIAFFLIPNLTQAQLDFKHWQTFQQSVAFAPLSNWPDRLVYQYEPAEQRSRFESQDHNRYLQELSTLPAYGTFNELGFFCTLDLKMDLKMKLPVRFRLGTLDAVNRKEGYYD